MANFPSPVKHYDQVEEAVVVLRQSLAKAESKSVTIVTVGFLTNIRDLLLSRADEISPLSGVELVKEKVDLVAIMGGGYPSSDSMWPFGSEFNFDCGKCCMGDSLECRGSAREVVNLLPAETKTVFLGFEVGQNVMSGGRLSECAGEENPCRQAYIDYLGYGVARPSWDPLTTLFAVRGARGIGCREEGVGGQNMVDMEGGNMWGEGETLKNMTYLVLEEGQEIAMGEVIDDLLCKTQRRITP